MRILLVDDDRVFCTALQRVLRGRHEITAVSSYDAGEQELETRQDWEAFVVDFGLPGRQGDKLATYAHALYPSIPIVFVSGGVPDRDWSRFERIVCNVGATYLEKPADANRLESAIRITPLERKIELRAEAVALEAGLPPARADILHRLAKGADQEAIALARNTEKESVQHELSSIYKALGVRGRTAAVLKVRDHAI